MRTMFGRSAATLVTLSSVTTNAFLILPKISISKPATGLHVLQEPPKNGVRVPRQDITDEMLEDMSRQMKDMNEQLEEWSNMYPRDPSTRSHNKKASYVFAGKKDYKVQPWYSGAPGDEANESTHSMDDSSIPQPSVEAERAEMEATMATEAIEEASNMIPDETIVEDIETVLEQPDLAPIAEEDVSETTTDGNESPLSSFEVTEQHHHDDEVYFQQDIPLNDEFVTGKTFKVEKRHAFRRQPLAEEEEIPADIVTPPNWNTDQMTRATNMRLAERLKNAHGIIKGLTAENTELKAIQSRHEIELAEIQTKLTSQEETLMREREAAKVELEIARREGSIALEAAKEEAKEMLTKTTKELQAKLNAAESLVAKLELAMKQANEKFVYIEEPPEPSPSVVPQDDFPTVVATEHSVVERNGVRGNIKKTLGVVKGAVGSMIPFKRAKLTEEAGKYTHYRSEGMPMEDGEDEPKLEA